ncbi:MAG: TRAP transporter large permease subunit [Deltaproteobacteria bacterium]|nr:MAG: TRAP transporter large permease subunit [Deltaproteobacteria bacterium]
MEWQLVLLLIFGSLVVLMLTGMPVAFCFMLISVVGMYVFFGGAAGLEQLIISICTSLATFVLLPVPLFIFMGELMFHSGMAPLLIESVDKWLGRLPGRLGLLAVSAGTLFSTLTGTSIASTAMLGTVLVPEMERQGYKKPMSLGPILGSGGLAMMIPPSALAVLCGAIAEISIGRILIAIIVPGLLMAILYAAYIIIRCWLQPSIAPAYEVSPLPLSEKLTAAVRHILPLGLIVFLVIGVIFLGIATPSEAAATGVIGTLILSFFYGRLSWEVIKKTASSTLAVAGMVLLIIAGARAFSQILAYSGVSKGLGELATGLPVAPIFIIIAMQVVILFLGGFMDVVAIMMITLPIFVPVVISLGFNTVWFAVVLLLNIEMAGTSPPFGLGLLVMKGVAPPDTTMEDIYRAALPFLGCDLIAMVLIIAFPELTLWLPGLMR